MRRSPAAVFAPSKSAHPPGLTLLELLVALGIISLILSLILPSVLRARDSARRITCLNNLRQVAVAMTANADKADRLPAAANFEATGSNRYHTWVTAILGELGQPALASSYDLRKPFDDDQNHELIQTPLQILVCPDDFTVVPGEGNLSYAVNGGLSWTVPIDCPASIVLDEDDEPVIKPLDLNGNDVICPLDPKEDGTPNDLDLLRRTSVFFVENWPPATGTSRFHRLTQIRDGTSQTIMVSENVRAGFNPDTGGTWGTPEPTSLMFFVSSRICEDSRCSKENIDLSLANDRSEGTPSREAINSGLEQPEGRAPWPSSGHLSGINMAFCDGHVQLISEEIDGAVYFALTTPQGADLDGPLQEPIVSADAY